MTMNDGVIDEERNPFAQPSWVEQGNKFTRHRSEIIEEQKLIGSTVEEIKAIKDRNIGAYPAFVAIRWGFAKIDGNRLVTTARWDDRELYFD